MWTCSICSAECTENHLFCSNCGQQREERVYDNPFSYSKKFYEKMYVAKLPIESATFFVIQRRGILTTYYYGFDIHTGIYQYVEEIEYAYRFRDKTSAEEKLAFYLIDPDYEFEILPVEIE